MFHRVIASVLLFICTVVPASSVSAEDGAVKKVGAQNLENSMSASEREIATFGGGCFWCIEAIFNRLKGVEKVESGYTGGSTENPTYEEVSSGQTGHAEVVQITFDPKVITFRELVKIFLHLHDPTTKNRQGADVGTQYRSAIFYHSMLQEQEAEGVIEEVEKAKLWPDPIVTTLEEYTKYYPAEGYHQNYYENNTQKPYCSVVIAPKIAKLYKLYADRLKP